MPSQRLPSMHQKHWLAATLAWLLAGGFLLLTTLVPAHTDLLGWTPTFWLLGAPLIVLLGLHPRLPGRLAGRRRSARVRAIHGVVWQ